MTVNKHDFSGYATKYGLKCTDGRTISPGAFKHMDGVRIPLVWSHGHSEVTNVLGHAVLEHRDDGVYALGFFNDTPGAQAAKQAVTHGDIVALSIYANKLVEKSNLVHSGDIRELSLVLSGANPGAFIDNVSIAHSDGTQDDLEDEVVISSMSPIELAKEEVVEEVREPVVEHAESDQTVSDVVETMNEVQKKVLYALVAQAMGDNEGGEAAQSDIEGDQFMKKNVFDNSSEGPSLSHDQLQEFAGKVFADAMLPGSTFKQAFMAHAGTYGIGSDRANMEILFPDAKNLDGEPEFETRRMGWVAAWLAGTRHVPFSRIKKVWADLTEEAARAKGYITGNEKAEQVFPILKRETAPQTIYKKQKLDRDDIIDITDFNVVNWLWKEMRFMLNEEVARAALVGDGRSAMSDDKIDPTKIRPIFGDNPLFVHYLTLEDTVVEYMDIIEAVQLARVNYKGTGTPNLYTTNLMLTSMLLSKDTTNRRIYKSVQELANDLRVADIIEVDVMENVTRTVDDTVDYDTELLGILVNPRDYTYGADKGGAIATFDDFDIDFNQYKYLIETRLSGSLLNPKSAMVIERKVA